MEIKRKENLWFHLQAKPNLHYEGKSFAGQESVNCTKQCAQVT